MLSISTALIRHQSTTVNLSQGNFYTLGSEQSHCWTLKLPSNYTSWEKQRQSFHQASGIGCNLLLWWLLDLFTKCSLWCRCNVNSLQVLTAGENQLVITFDLFIMLFLRCHGIIAIRYLSIVSYSKVDLNVWAFKVQPLNEFKSYLMEKSFPAQLGTLFFFFCSLSLSCRTQNFHFWSITVILEYAALGFYS